MVQMDNCITIDSSLCRTTLCNLCLIAGTDKSPFTANGGHRHPYTTPYSLFFEPLKNKPIKFAEIGIFRGGSLLVWRNFFPRARIYGFDNDVSAMECAKAYNMPGVWIDHMDATSAESMESAFHRHMTDGELFDVILDDALHSVEQQAVTIRTCMNKLKQGGLLLIEDIFRDQDHAPYVKVMEEVKDLISFSTFIVCDHTNRYSPGWNNDKLLVLVRA
jgi:predicted O-methyltransferase YrrM